MTTDQPFGPESSDPFTSTDQPSWGTAGSTPPAGAGTDPGPSFAGPSGPTSPPAARFFDRVRALGIVRADEGRWIAGVAAGIARRYRIDPIVVRIAFVIISLFGGLGVLLYGLGWLFLPHPDGRIHAQQVLNGTVTVGFVGALLTVLAIGHHAIPLLLVALIVWMIVRHRRTGQAPA